LVYDESEDSPYNEDRDCKYMGFLGDLAYQLFLDPVQRGRIRARIKQHEQDYEREYAAEQLARAKEQARKYGLD